MSTNQTAEKFAFTMQLYPGKADEYKQRHDAVWPEISELLKQAGVFDYSIHLDLNTHTLFAVLWRKLPHRMDALPTHPAMQCWWAYMADIMVTKADANGLVAQADNEHPANNEPVVTELLTVFHME